MQQICGCKQKRYVPRIEEGSARGPETVVLVAIEPKLLDVSLYYQMWTNQLRDAKIATRRCLTFVRPLSCMSDMLKSLRK